MQKKKESPGTVLNALLKKHGLNYSSLAKAVGLSGAMVRLIALDENPVSAAVAFRLAAFFKTGPEYWLALQAAFDISRTAKDKKLAKALKAITTVDKAEKAARPGRKPKAKKTAKKSKTAKKPAGKRGRPAAKTASAKAGAKKAVGKKAGAKTRAGKAKPAGKRGRPSGKAGAAKETRQVPQPQTPVNQHDGTVNEPNLW